MSSRCGRVRAGMTWLLLLGWMAFIFLMSAQNAQTSSRMSGAIARPLARVMTPGFDQMKPAEQRKVVARVQFGVRKAAHAFEFGVLGVLLLLSLSRIFRSLKWQGVLSLAIAILYAMGDEWHQGFVAGRGPAWSDVLIDAAGSLLGIGMVLLFRRAPYGVRRRNRPGDDE